MSYTTSGEGQPAKRTVQQFRRCAAAAALGAVAVVSGGILASSAAFASTNATDRQVVPDDLIESTLSVLDENQLIPLDSTAEDKASPAAPDGENMEPEQLAGQHVAPGAPEPGRTGQSGASHSASPTPDMVSSGAGNAVGAESLSAPSEQKQGPEQPLTAAPGQIQQRRWKKPRIQALTPDPSQPIPPVPSLEWPYKDSRQWNQSQPLKGLMNPFCGVPASLWQAEHRSRFSLS